MTAPIPPAPRSATTPARASQSSRTTSISPATKATPRPSCSSPTWASSTASTPTSRPPAPATAPSKPHRRSRSPNAGQLPVPPDVRQRRIADGAVRGTRRRRLRHGDSEEQHRGYPAQEIRGYQLKDPRQRGRLVEGEGPLAAGEGLQDRTAPGRPAGPDGEDGREGRHRNR